MTEFEPLEERLLSTGWTHGAREFTPWLAENLGVLSKAIALPLSLVDRERRIGRDSLDMLLEDDQGRRVIVEIETEVASSSQLGKLLSFCACTEAKVVIWIAARFNDEHVVALEWLNNNSLTDIGFFAVEVHLYQIGESPLALHCRAIVRPNEWAKHVHSESQAQRTWSGFGSH